MNYNIYCDESCHLEHDQSSVMGLGALLLPREHIRSINLEIKKIKLRFGTSQELKWTNLHPAKLTIYKAVVDLFFNNNFLNFRAVIIHKKRLNHKLHNQTHEDFYYKMYYLLLDKLFEPGDAHNVYIDIKDTRFKEKVARLTNYLNNAHHDNGIKAIENFFVIRSHEVEVMQITDILLGALVSNSREINRNKGKQELINYIKSRSGHTLDSTNRDSKLNILHFLQGAN